MLTQTVTITQNSNPNIIIGRRSTYETQQVIFDVSWLAQTYGEGTAELLIKRPKDASAYPVVATLDGNTLTWTVSETDTQDKGHGECEIYWYVNGGLAKSCICGITILRDIGDTTETAPDPYETWVDELARLGAETLTNAQAAEQSANDAAQSASEADNSAAAALESKENALDSENAAKASEQAAAASAQGVEQYATAARQAATEAANSASTAESSASDAQGAADNASASADRAEQAAASIEGDTERAEAAAQTAQGAASDASGFAGTASTKATEAAGSAATATQKATDASASATSAAGSASSASASATAAGNAQSAAETAQGKAEDAQEAAETAAQSIEDSAAQIDENTAGLVELRSALNTKAGVIRDTVSGSVASFVPDATIDNLLGVSVDIEPVQDLNGYDNPWPAGGGKNLIDFDQVVTEIVNTPAVYLTAGTYYLYVANEKTLAFNSLAQISTDGNTFTDISTDTGSSNAYADQTMQYNVKKCIVSVVNPTYLRVRVQTNAGLSGAKVKVLLTKDATNYSDIPNGLYSTNRYFEQIWAPYSNICPISGWNAVGIGNSASNLIDASAVANGFLQPTNGVVYDNQNWNVTPFISARGGDYTLSWDSAVSTYQGTICAYDANQHYITGVNCSGGMFSHTFTLPFGTSYLRASWSVAVSGNPAVRNNIRLNFGSADLGYTPYVAGSTYSITFPTSAGTVYGGTLDVTTGKLTVDRAIETYSSSNGFVEHGSDRWYHSGLPSGADYSKRAEAISNQATYFDSQNTYNPYFAFGSAGVYINKLSADETIEQFSTRLTENPFQLVYKLATPIVYDLTPTVVSTLLGTNNVWADTGDVDVTFAADLKTYIDQKIATAVAALS